MSAPDKKTTKDWIDAGLEALYQEGPEGLRVKRLARSLGVTTGSFYWHFKNIDEYNRQMLDHWIKWDTVQTIQDAREDEHPLQRLEEIVEQRNLHKYGDAIQAWALVNEDAARAVARVEKMRHQRMAQLLVSTGMDERTASVRAQIIVWMVRGWPHSDDAWRLAVLRELMDLVSPVDDVVLAQESQHSSSGGVA